MIAVFHKYVTKIIELLHDLFDYGVRYLNKIILKLGSNGYLLYGVLSNVLFFISTLILKFFPGIDWSIYVVFRGMTNVALGYLVSNTHKKDLTYKKEELKYVCIRNILIASQQTLFFFVIVTIPIKITWIINNTGPIFIFILGYFMKGTLLSKKDFFFLMISLIGVYIISVPQLFKKIASFFFPIDEEDFIGEMNPFQIFVALILFLSQAVWAFAVIYGTFCKTLSAVAVNYSFGLTLSLIGSLTLIARSSEIVMISYSEILLICLTVGIPMYVSSVLYIQGTLVATDQGKLSLMNYLPVFFSYGEQILFEGRIPKIFEIFGIFLAFVGLYKVAIKPKVVKNDIKEIDTSKQIEKRLDILTEKEINLPQEEETIQHFHHLEESNQKGKKNKDYEDKE